MTVSQIYQTPQQGGTVDLTHFSRVYSDYVSSITRNEWQALLVRSLSDPAAVVAEHARNVQSKLAETSLDLSELVHEAANTPILHFESIFDPTDLPSTPSMWSPVPPCLCATKAVVTTLLLNDLLGLETVSYGSENAGDLFVNLVGMAGNGALAEKSRKNMRGHTDAASFPFRGQLDPQDPRIAPSPDFVCLASLRNPNDVPTRVLPLDNILARLAPSDVELLKRNGFLIFSQRTFRAGTLAALGQEHSVDGGAVLWESPEGLWVRYSHSTVTPVGGDDPTLVDAQARFEQACKEAGVDFVLRPGDIAFVNNRKALHGRGEVGAAIGGNSRWLLRSYGLNTSSLSNTQRTGGKDFQLFP